MSIPLVLVGQQLFIFMTKLPLNSEFVLQVAVTFAPERFLQLHFNRAAILQLVKTACDVIEVLAYISEADVISLNKWRTRKHIREQDIAVIDVKSRVHD